MQRTFLVLGILIIAAGGFLIWKYGTANTATVLPIQNNTTSTVSASTTIEAPTSTDVIQPATSSQPGNAATSTPQSAPVASIQILNSAVYEGDTLLISFSNGIPVSADFNGSPMHIFEFGGEEHAVYPIADIFTPGNYVISAKFQNGKVIQRNVQVLKFQFPTYQMGQPGGTPSPEVQAELTAQAAEFNSTFANPDTAVDFTKTFVPPLHTALKVTSAYGEVRYYTGGGAARHLGIDFAAPVGTPVYSINAGTVVKVRNYLSYGNTIIIDHGSGIFSMYLHLSKVLVREGQKVFRNQEIGLSGDTGYETGPHLHLSLKIGGVSVDPMKFINILNGSK